MEIVASRKLRQQARRNVRTQTAPQRNEIDRQQLQSNQDYLNALQGARSAYGGFQNELGNVPRFPLQQLSGQLQDQLGQFHDALGGTPEGVPSEVYGQPVGLPQSEAQAGTALYSQLGGNAFNTLTNDAARASMYRQSAGREGALAERYARENLLQGLQDRYQGFDQSRMQLADMMPGMISSEMDRLIQQHQADAQNKALSQWLQSYITGAATQPPRDGGGPSRPGGGTRKATPNVAATPNQGGYWTGEPTGQNAGPGAPAPGYAPPGSAPASSPAPGGYWTGEPTGQVMGSLPPSYNESQGEFAPAWQYPPTDYYQYVQQRLSQQPYPGYYYGG